MCVHTHDIPIHTTQPYIPIINLHTHSGCVLELQKSFSAIQRAMLLQSRRGAKGVYGQCSCICNCSQERRTSVVDADANDPDPELIQELLNLKALTLSE